MLANSIWSNLNVIFQKNSLIMHCLTYCQKIDWNCTLKIAAISPKKFESKQQNLRHCFLIYTNTRKNHNLSLWCSLLTVVIKKRKRNEIQKFQKNKFIFGLDSKFQTIFDFFDKRKTTKHRKISHLQMCFYWYKLACFFKNIFCI